MNNWIAMGRIANDPDIRVTQSGSMVCRFNLAVNRRFKREGEPDADFFTCICFGKIAENFDKLKISKGTKLLVDGEWRNNNYTDKNGVKRYENQVMINHFEFCESKGSSQGSSPVHADPVPQSNDGFISLTSVEDDDLPWA